MKIQIKNHHPKIKIQKHKIRKTVSHIFHLLGVHQEISILFTDDDEIKKLNQRYLGKNQPTNVLSFSLQEGDCGTINPDILGDVVISLDTAGKDAAAGNLSLEHEVIFLLIHGILHLMGYRHEKASRQESDKMKKKEKEIFYKVIQDPNVMI